jgi:surface protein
MIGSSKIGLRPIRGGGAGAAPNPDFVSTWDTTNAGSASDTIVLPMTAGNTVHWGDGNTDTTNTHTYASSGTYTITIEGTITGWAFNGGGDRLKILDVSNVGALTLSVQAAFRSCSNMTWTATDSLLITTNKPHWSFYGCTNFNGDVSLWDVSACTDFGSADFGSNRGMFSYCTSFVGTGLENWDMSNATRTQLMFTNCSSLAPTSLTWDVTSLSNAISMFSGCASFNADLSTWITSSLANVSSMFKGCTSYNQNMNDWDMTNVSDTTSMFSNCSAFNGNIADWVTTNFTNVKAMFYYATNFNVNISDWDMSNVVTFGDAAFGAKNGMFYNAASFNQPIGVWDTSSGLDFRNFLDLVPNFDQDLSNFQISQATQLGNIFSNTVNFSTANYDALLIAWDAQGAMSYSGTVNFGGSTYTLGGAAEAARTSLISKWGGIIDGGGV